MKSTNEMISVMRAYECGEQIQFCVLGDHPIWSIWDDVIGIPTWDWSKYDYRVKSKAKYVPFESAEEFLKAQWEHGESILFDDDDRHYFAFVNAFNEVRIERQDVYTTTFENLLASKGKFKDGTPCGKETIYE